MIDWPNVLYNFLWILGLAVLLTALSLAHWLAGQHQRPMRQHLSEPSFRLALAVGFMLFAVGMALIVEPWWHKVSWLGILVLSTWEGIVAWRARSGQTKRS